MSKNTSVKKYLHIAGAVVATLAEIGVLLAEMPVEVKVTSLAAFVVALASRWDRIFGPIEKALTEDEEKKS